MPDLSHCRGLTPMRSGTSLKHQCCTGNHLQWKPLELAIKNAEAPPKARWGGTLTQVTESQVCPAALTISSHSTSPLPCCPGAAQNQLVALRAMPCSLPAARPCTWRYSPLFCTAQLDQVQGLSQTWEGCSMTCKGRLLLSYQASPSSD